MAAFSMTKRYQIRVDESSTLLPYFEGSSYTLPYVQIATWNDYEEGTEVEAGIDNCYTISASVNYQSRTLNWTLGPSDSYASTSTIRHFTVWWSYPDDPNQQINIAADNIASNQTSISLSSLRVPLPQPPDHTLNLYVEMVGVPLVLIRVNRSIFINR
jgi:hypothetical protein